MMPTIPSTHVSISTAKRDLSRLTNEVYYSGKRVILTSKGNPKVALVKLDDLERLEQAVIAKAREMHKQHRLQAFERLKKLRQELIAETGGNLPDPVEVLRQLREDRDQHLTDGVRGR